MAMAQKFSQLIRKLWTTCAITVTVLLLKRRNRWLYDQRTVSDMMIGRECRKEMEEVQKKLKKFMHNSVADLLIIHNLKLPVKSGCYWAMPPALEKDKHQRSFSR